MTTPHQDSEHLRLLAIFHYVVAGVTALFACLPLIHLTLGIAMLTGWGEFGQTSDPPPAFVGWIMVLFPAAFILAGWAFAVCLVLAGRYLQQRRRYTFCLVMAAVSCILVPFGTVLGVFTIVVLMRESVKALFDHDAAPAAA